jgi:hypothetical protein
VGIESLNSLLFLLFSQNNERSSVLVKSNTHFFVY